MSYTVDKIREEYSIFDYLSKKGIHPAKDNGGCKVYCCPIHGKDKTPSFYLWQKDCGKQSLSYENFKCFGCKAGKDIISLYAALECNGNWGQAINELAKGINLTIEGELNHLINSLNKSEEEFNKDSLEELSLKISRCMYNYMEQVDFDEKEINNFCEKTFKIIDKAILALDYDSVYDIYSYMTEKEGIRNRIKKYHNKERENRIKNLNSIKEWTR